jgi:small-conductance mechanosensitive channel
MANLTRRDKEKRAYTLALVGGSAGIATVVFLVLAIAGVMGLGPAILAAIVSAAATFGFRRTVGS